MITTKSKLVEDECTISNRTYTKQQFFGPHLDFIEKESKTEVIIELGRSYAEDAKYATVTRVELATKLLYEVSQEHDKPIVLRIWGKRLNLHNTKDEHEIYQKLVYFILKNVSF